MVLSVRKFLIDFIKKFKYEIIIFYSSNFIQDCSYLFFGGYLLKLISNKAENKDFKNITFYCILYCLLLTFNYIVRFFNKNIEYIVRKKIDKNYILSYFTKILKYDNEYFSDNLTGQLTTKLFNIQKKLEHIFACGIDVIGDILVFFIGVLIFYFIIPNLSYFSILWFVFYIFIITFLLKWQFKIFSKNAEEKSKSMGVINDCFINIMNIKMFATERKEYRKIKKQSLDILKNENQILFSANILNAFNYFFMGVFIFGTLTITFIDYIHGKTSIGTILFVSQFSLHIVYWVNYAIKISFEIINDISTIDNSLKTLLIEPKIKNKIGAKNIKINDGRIVLKDVRFGYEK